MTCNKVFGVSSCLFNRVLPFALTLVVGLALGMLFQRERHPNRFRLEGSYYSRCRHGESGIGSGVYGWEAGFVKARILSKPEPQYTELARQNETEGEVLLRVVLSSDGDVRDVVVLKGLPDGLTDEAIEAAKDIKFIPAMKDGQSISQTVTASYDFNLH